MVYHVINIIVLYFYYYHRYLEVHSWRRGDQESIDSHKYSDTVLILYYDNNIIPC